MADSVNPNSRKNFHRRVLQKTLYRKIEHVSVNLEENQQKNGVCVDWRNLILEGDILANAMTVSGSIIFRVVLPYPNCRNRIFKAIINNILEVMTDHIGHFLFMDLVPLCTPSELVEIVNQFKSHTNLFINMLLNRYGSDSLLKLMEKLIEVKEELLLVRLLSDEIYTIMTHQEGTGKYVIIKCFSLLKYDSFIEYGSATHMLYNALIVMSPKLAMHQVGSICLKDCIEFMSDSYRDVVLITLCDRSALLSTNPSGVHFLEYVINRDNPIYKDEICSNLKGNYVRLSLQRKGSSLVHTCLRTCGLRYVIEEFVANNNKLLQVACDKYGNSVIQIAIQMTMAAADKELHRSLLQALQSLEKHPNGKVLYRLMKSKPISDLCICKDSRENLQDINKRDDAGPSLDFQQSDLNPGVEDSMDSVNKFVSLAMTLHKPLMCVLDDPELVIQIFGETVDDIFELMNDEYGHRVFMKLVGLLDIDVINTTLLKLITKNQLLISASLYNYGSNSVLKLIEVLHKTPLIQQLTEALAEGIVTLLTHERGKLVVLECFRTIDSENYKTLYEALRNKCCDLALNERGCISLCDCMDVIKNPHRDLLLNDVLDHSRLLSASPFGIHFLDYVTRLQDPRLTSKLCSSLKGSYGRLSLLKNGHHIVQYCLTSSFRMKDVVEDLVELGLVLQVASDEIGIHVILTALKWTKKKDKILHSYLLKALEPHMQILKLRATGKSVYCWIQSNGPLD